LLTVPRDLQNMKDPGYEMFIAGISILSVFNMIYGVIPGMDEATLIVVATINFGLTIVFVGDFLYRFLTTPSRSYYLFHDWGWADFLAIAPLFRILRLFRVAKAYRFVTRYGTDKIRQELSDHRAESALYLLIFAVILIIEFGSIGVLYAERPDPHANIVSASDALWWAYVTITTVGSGDQYPVTNQGRLVGILVMTTGVGVFATFAGYIGHKLLSPTKSKKKKEAEDSVAKTLAELGRFVKERETRDEEILIRLEQLEQAIADRSKPHDAGNDP
jgi:voltage-gated potassium channel